MSAIRSAWTFYIGPKFYLGRLFICFSAIIVIAFALILAVVFFDPIAGGPR